MGRRRTSLLDVNEAEIAKRIPEMENDQIPWAHPQIGRFPARAIGEAESIGAIRIGRVVDGQARFEHAILAAKILRFRDNAANRGTGAGISWGLRCLSGERPIGEAEQDCNNNWKELLLH